MHPKPLLGAFRWRLGGRICPFRFIARRFVWAAAGAHLVVPRMVSFAVHSSVSTWIWGGAT
jgi:hypothetical protein